MNTDSLIGLTEKGAVRKINAAGLKARVRRRDGKSFIGTCDHRMDRVNLEIDKGRVTKARIG